jgi:hypothetical protein
MNGIVALIIAGSLLLTAVGPVAAINDGTSNTRSGAATHGRPTAGQHGAPVHAETREGSNVRIVRSADFPPPPAR